MPGIRRGSSRSLPAVSTLAIPVESVTAVMGCLSATHKGNLKKVIPLVRPWSCAHNARCAVTPTAMPVSRSDNACGSALKNLSKKSLRLLTDVEAESRKRQVLPAPRMPNAKRDHLSLMQGKETVTRLAPRKRERSGWRSVPQLPLANYGCHWSRG